MQVYAVLFLAAVALARPQTSSYDSGAVTTVTERTFTIRGDGSTSTGSSAADKYYGTASSGVSSYSNGASGVSSYSAAPAQQSYKYQTVASAVPVAQQSYYQQYEAAAPAYAYQAAAPAVAYQAAAYQAPAVAFQAVTAAPAVAYQTATVAPAVAYQTVTAAPAVAYKAAVSQRVENNYENNYNNNYETSLDQTQYAGGETKVFKHVYAFAAPEEPATRARISVQAPVNKRKHYKLVFIKTPSQQTIVDSDITLPAQEEEKTLIYLLSKDRKQAQPEIRIKQAEASKHAKPEVFFLKYRNEQEAQAIASGAISGQTSDVPANGEIISDGSVSILGQSSDQSSFSSGSSFAADNAFRSGAASSGASNVVYRGGFASGNAGLSSGFNVAAVPATTYTSGINVAAVPAATYTSGLNAATLVSNVAAVPAATYTSGLSSAALVSDVAAGPATSYTSGSRTGFSFGAASGSSASSASSGSAGLSGGFSAYSQEPASVAIKVSGQPEESSFEASTAGSLAL